MNIIGLSAFFHDSTCCLLQDGKLICAAEEERFSRRKHDASLPWRAFTYCLDQARLTLADIDAVAYYEQPQLKLERQLWMGLQPNAGRLIKDQVRAHLDPGRVEASIRQGLGYRGALEFVTHHQAHAASSYFFSGFTDAALMTVDAVGEWATTTYGQASDKTLDLFEEVHFPHSIGMFYSALTAYLGFEVNSGEYKVMGLAPYGQPRYADKLRTLIEPGKGGQFRLNLTYFDFLEGGGMFSGRLADLLGRPPRAKESEIESFHQDVARSLQVVLEEFLLTQARWLRTRVSSNNLCLAGGVALNCVANGRLRREGPFEHIFIQPAAGDSGGALGAAALAQIRLTDKRPSWEPLQHVYLGPGFDSSQVRRLLTAAGVQALSFEHNESGLMAATVDRLMDGKVIGWFQGRMELGPRALGARSILADPRRSDMRQRINDLVKKREAFRPFAPAVLADHAAKHFELNGSSPFMLETCAVRSSLDLPAITHVDRSARVQTVHRDTHARFYTLIEAFHHRTGCPMLLNTSFNMRGEPMVCTPADAVRCFVRSSIDVLVLEDFILDRGTIPALWKLIAEADPLSESAISHEVYTLF